MRHAANTNPFRTVAIRFNAHSLQLHIDAQPVRLTQTEGKVLAYLLKRRGEWVHHDELRRRVTSGEDQYDSSLVRVHLYNLRKRLGENACLLRTERNQGTRIVGEWSVSEGWFSCLGVPTESERAHP